MRSTSGASRPVFVDTGAYFGIADRRDHNHASATAIVRRLVADRRPLYTTNFIVAETHALVLKRIDREMALTVLEDIYRSRLTTVVRVSEEDELRARAIIRQYQDKDFSLVDAMSFAVMERLGIRHAFTFDCNFAQYGWAILAPGQS